MRNRTILRILVFAVSAALVPFADCLSGDHVCTRVENQTITVRETYTEPVIVQTYTWCLQVPPRCAKTRLENRTRYRIKTTVEDRTISECCEGYVVQELHVDAEADPKCIPFCKSCENGLCTMPNVCQCETGYQGDSCAHECPPGSWGRQCMQQCDCASGGSCNPVNGICECPAGWRGPGCKLPCPVGRWGFRCESACDCGGRLMACHPETGYCHTGSTEDSEVALSGNWTTEDLFQAVQMYGLVSDVSSSGGNTTETSRGTEATVYDVDSGTKGYTVTRVSRTTEHADDDGLRTASEIPEEFDLIKPEFPVPDLAESPLTTRFEDTITPGVSDEELFRRNEVDDKIVKIVGPPHPSYVKTLPKEQEPQISHDTMVLIVVGSVVSICLTTLAVLMVFYLRSKVLETIPMSIYDSGKNGGADQEKGNTIRSLKITNTTLPPLPTFVNPVFATNPETALITFDAAELNKHYDNRTGTISIRVSGNIRDLLESHYDRPPAATCRHIVDQNAEHVYDEIPLSMPLCVRKEDLVP